MLDNRGIEFYGVVHGARWLISAQSSAPNHAFQTRNSSDRLARAGGAALSILPRSFLMRQCACRQPVCLFFFCRGHVCSCVLGLPPNALDPAPVSDCGLATTPLPHWRISVGSCVQFPPSSLSPRIQWPFASSTCLETSEDPCPFASSVFTMGFTPTMH